MESDIFHLSLSLSLLPLQREERRVLRELKNWLDQLERDILRVQGAEGNLTDKYQVSRIINHDDDKCGNFYCVTFVYLSVVIQ